MDGFADTALGRVVARFHSSRPVLGAAPLSLDLPGDVIVTFTEPGSLGIKFMTGVAGVEVRAPRRLSSAVTRNGWLRAGCFAHR